MPEQNSMQNSNDAIFIGPSTTVFGAIKTQSKVIVSGVFNGNIEAPTVVVHSNARVFGKIVADYVEIFGYAGDEIISRQFITIHSFATVSGKLVHAGLNVETGANLQAALARYEDYVGLSPNQKAGEKTQAPPLNETPVVANKVNQGQGFEKYQEEVALAGKHEISVSQFSFGDRLSANAAQEALKNGANAKDIPKKTVVGWTLPVNYGIPLGYIEELAVKKELPVVWGELVQENGQFLVILIEDIRPFTPPPFEEVASLYT